MTSHHGHSRHRTIPLEWFQSDDAHAFMEFCFDEWDKLPEDERQQYDGWVGGFVLSILGDGLVWGARDGSSGRIDASAAIVYARPMVTERPQDQASELGGYDG